MDFIGNYLEQQLEGHDFARRLANQPFAMQSDIDRMQKLSDDRKVLFSRTIDPLISEGDPKFLDNSDYSFLYRSKGLRLQIFFQRHVQQFVERQREITVKRLGKKVPIDPLNARLSAQESVMRRNEGLIDVARQDMLMRLLDETSPRLAERVRSYHDENQSLPQFLGGKVKDIKDVVYAPYERLGVEIDAVTEQRLKVRVMIFRQAHELATKNSGSLWRYLNGKIVPNKDSDASPDGREPK